MRTIIEALHDMLDREIGDIDDINAGTAHHVDMKLLYTELKKYCEEIIEETAYIALWNGRQEALKIKEQL